MSLIKRDLWRRDAKAAPAQGEIYFAALVAAACILSFAVLAFRTYSALSNYDLGTSGLEGPGVLGVIRACQNRILYRSLLDNPTAMLYNAGFYYFYGMVSRIFSNCSLSSLLWTKIITSIAFILCAVVINFLGPRPGRWERLLIASLFTSPVIGWWMFATRPDGMGLLFFTISAVFIARHLTNGSERWVVMSALALLLAWSFKQTYAAYLPALAVPFLIVQWRAAVRWAVYSGLSIAAGLIVCYVFFGPAYIEQTIAVNSVIPIAPIQAVLVMLGVIKKLSFFFVVTIGTAGLVWLRLQRSSWLEVDPPQGRLIKFFAFALPLIFVLSVVMGARAASADYYLFPVLVAACLLMLSLPLGRLRRFSAIALAVTLALDSTLVLSGKFGQLVTPDRTLHDRLTAEIFPFNGNKLVLLDWEALPWFSGQVDPILVDSLIYLTMLRVKPGAIADIYAEVAANAFDLIVLPDPSSVGPDRAGLEANIRRNLVGRWDQRTIEGTIILTRDDEP